MAAVGPFEAAPHLAVAVSGGADSLALCLLAHCWAGARGGCVTALTVDHGLRPGSRADALQVGRWLKKRQIEHTVLCWIGDKPATGIQEAARSARYGLMSQWCEAAGVLHLLLGHHQQDQAETVLMRHCQGSGVDGLAGMAAIVETAAVRRVRPLLKTSPARLRAVLSADGQPWIEDPSNSDPAHTRNRLRALLPRLSESDNAVSAVVANAARMARSRAALEGAVSTLLGRCCQVYPCGYACFDARPMAVAPPEVATRALGGLMSAIGGRMHPPPSKKLERVFFRLVRENSLAAMTLGRCRLVRTGDRILVCREQRGLPPPQIVNSSGAIHWDGRFLIDVAASADNGDRDICLTALGASGASQIAKFAAATGAGAGEPVARCLRRVPRPVRAVLPALADDTGILAVPHLDYARPDGGNRSVRIRAVSFRPERSLTGGGRYLA